MKNKQKTQGIYPQLIENIEDWPIFKLHADRRNFIQSVDQHTLEEIRIEYPDADKMRELLMKTIYQERIRIKEDPWKVDPPDERSFWKKIQQEVYHASTNLEGDEASKVYEDLLLRIIHRYSEEIVGTFRIKTFLFARKFLTFFFSRLLNAASARRIRHIFKSRLKLYQRLQARGELEIVRSLMSKGTVVVVPTHFSNLDSILVGYVMDEVVGLPSFSYGAGLNLLNSGIPAYYINRIGAYRVDRRKKNPIYLKVLKSFSNKSIQRGTNTLFFPGGTRSRSGELETRLKMGLLGTTVEAQRNMLKEGRKEKVFIVPVVLGYNVVLEAKFLIEQHLKRTGRERYLRSKDQFYSTWQILKFVWNLFSKNSTITTSFGKPMDVLGNFVDAEGRSFDRFGREVEISEYFMTDGEINADRQREREYTKLLSERIVDRYFKENIVLPSHLVAFAAFNLLKRSKPELDLYGILRLPTDDITFANTEMLDALTKLQSLLVEMAAQGKLKLSEAISGSAADLLKEGVSTLGTFHPKKPLVFTKRKDLKSQDLKLLYYYQNRLEHYELEKVFELATDIKEAASVSAK